MTVSTFIVPLTQYHPTYTSVDNICICCLSHSFLTFLTSSLGVTKTGSFILQQYCITACNEWAANTHKSLWTGG